MVSADGGGEGWWLRGLGMSGVVVVSVACGDVECWP